MGNQRITDETVRALLIINTDFGIPINSLHKPQIIGYVSIVYSAMAGEQIIRKKNNTNVYQPMRRPMRIQRFKT